MSSTLADALAGARARLGAAGIESAELDARVLLERAAGLGRTELLARGREPIDAPSRKRYERLLVARARRVPLAYLTGEREFWSLPLRVDRRVLVPRPETETLVEAALARLGPEARIADIGTGSGALALALASELPAAALWAVDVSAAALELARENAAALGLAARVDFREGELLEPLEDLAGTLDAIVSNPPYIPTREIPLLQPEVREHEPRCALDGGADGLRALARLVAGAPRLLRRGGWLLLEVGAGQAAAVTGMLRASGEFAGVGTRRDLAGIARVVEGRRAA